MHGPYQWSHGSWFKVRVAGAENHCWLCQGGIPSSATVILRQVSSSNVIARGCMDLSLSLVTVLPVTSRTTIRFSIYYIIEKISVSMRPGRSQLQVMGKVRVTESALLSKQQQHEHLFNVSRVPIFRKRLTFGASFSMQTIDLRRTNPVR